MSVPTIKPVAVKAGHPNFRSLAKPRWMPPGQQALFNQKRMGQKKLGQSSTDGFIKNVGYGALGAAGIFIGTKLPSPWGLFAIGAGLIGVGYSLNKLFGSDQEAPPGGVLPEGSYQKIPEATDFDKISGKFESPKMYESYWFNPSGEMILSNTSPKDVDIILTIKQYKDEKNHQDPSNARDFRFVGNAFKGAVKVRAGGTEVVDFAVIPGWGRGNPIKLEI